jgi:hypothetical protein
MPLVGVKHLIQCHCILPQFKESRDPVFHKFAVFSILDEDSDIVQPKFAQCNNCGIVHKVVDVCKSELTSKEESKTLPSIIDIRLSLPKSLSEVLDSYQCDVSTWEHAEWIYLNKIWDSWIILTREEDEDGDLHGKRLIFLGDERFKIEAF